MGKIENQLKLVLIEKYLLRKINFGCRLRIVTRGYLIEIELHQH